MNKIQYIELLKLRGINNLNEGETIANAVKRTGGDPSLEEMVKVNKNAMDYYINELQELKEVNKALRDENNSLLEDKHLLDCLKAAGVDNWGGYDYAIDIYNGDE